MVLRNGLYYRMATLVLVDMMAMDKAQLDRIEDLLRQLLQALIAVNRRLDLVCGHELQEPKLRFFGEIPL